MADSTSKLVTEKNTGEEMDTQLRPSEYANVPNIGEMNSVDHLKQISETEKFKKPAVFATPFSIGIVKKKNVGINVSRTITQEFRGSKEDHVNEQLSSNDLPIDEYGSKTCKDNLKTSEIFERTPEKSDLVENEENSVPFIKNKIDAKHRFPDKNPPMGTFKTNSLSYIEPVWGGTTESPYSFEIIKDGTIIDTIPLTERSYFVVGRLPVCDVSLEHPSISRYHAVVQYRKRYGDKEAVGGETGFYIFDLDSTHGTFVNKNKITPKNYIRIRVGHVLKFGGSTRLFVLQGPVFDKEEESELTVTELREQARKHRKDLERRMMGNGDEENNKDQHGANIDTQITNYSKDAGCSWGMGDDATPEEDENDENPFATEFQDDQEASYLKDPKKALQGFYDREGEELEFEYEDKGQGSWLCRIKLPVDNALGKQLVAEVTHTGKKKDAAIQVSLEACRMLEARGLLRQEAVSRKRKKKNWEDEDFYDSDDDAFLDRTGAIERKRTERMKRAGKIEERPETYDSLVEKLSEVDKELMEAEMKLTGSGTGGSYSSSDDPLEAFMSVVQTNNSLDGVERRKLHVHIAELRKEHQRLRKLVDLTRPAQLPSLQTGSGDESLASENNKKLYFPMFGAMKGGSKLKLKTGTIGKLPSKLAIFPTEDFNLKKLPSGGEDEEEGCDGDKDLVNVQENSLPINETIVPGTSLTSRQKENLIHSKNTKEESVSNRLTIVEEYSSIDLEEQSTAQSSTEGCGGTSQVAPKKSGKKRIDPNTQLSQYPEDDPDYCVWVPPKGQSGDGRTHLNEKYGY